MSRGGADCLNKRRNWRVTGSLPDSGNSFNSGIWDLEDYRVTMHQKQAAVGQTMKEEDISLEKDQCTAGRYNANPLIC